MEFNIKQSSPERSTSSCIVVGVYEGKKLTAAAEVVNRASGGAISKLLELGDVEGKVGSTRLVYGLSGTAANRILLVGLGGSKTVAPKNWLTSVRAAALALAESGAIDASVYFADVAVERRDMAWKARNFVLACADALYRFNEMKSEKPPARRLVEMSFCLTGRRDVSVSAHGLKEGIAIAAGMSLARDLGNLPGNICTPSYLADKSTKMSQEWKLEAEVLEQRDMAKLGMGLSSQ